MVATTKITALEVEVRYSTSAYQAAARGQRASSTHSAEVAAERLGQKVFGTGYKHLQRRPPKPGDTHVVSRFCLHGVEENNLVL